MVLLDLSADLEAISEHRGTGTSHNAQLPAQIGQVLHLGRRAGSWRHTSGAAGPAKHVAQDLAEDVSARHLGSWSGLSARHGDPHRPAALPARHGYLEGPAFNDHRLDASFPDALLELTQNMAEQVATRRGLLPSVGWHRRDLATRNGNLLRARRRAGRAGRPSSENLAEDVPERTSRVR